MQAGPFLKILKNKGGKFSGMSYFGGYFLKTELFRKNPIPILFWIFS